MKHCFIVNPAAGKGKKIDWLIHEIEQTFSSSGEQYEIYRTTGSGDAADYVRRTAMSDPEESYRFYACGGDGTLCEAVCGVMRLPNRENVALGVIPIGTGNDFVRNFSEPAVFSDISAQVRGVPCWLDVLQCNQIYALNMVNVGFDCEVVVKTAKLKKRKWIPSGFAYIGGLLLTLIRKPCVQMAVTVDAQPRKSRTYLLNTYANGGFCGGGFHSNPRSSLCDGKIDALFVKDISRMKFVSLVGDYQKGTHLKPSLEHILWNEKADTVDLIFEKETPVSVDGEIVYTRELHLSVLEGALPFLVPAGVSLVSTGNRSEAVVQ